MVWWRAWRLKIRARHLFVWRLWVAQETSRVRQTLQVEKLWTDTDTWFRYTRKEMHQLFIWDHPP